ncbi:MAG: hypothetical protein KF822_11820 [Steroidobacteraceae bacterium]|nr:hypothetical protein [Steroidobacteraceae bacterium]
MYEANSYGIHRNLGGLLAAFIVVLGGLVFDRAHLASAPDGSVEIGQLTPVEAEGQIAALPEIVVTGRKA